MPYLEDLTNCGVCPPVDAFAPDGATTYYRVVRENPVTSESFFPTIPRFEPEQYDPCILKAVSVFTSIEGMANGLSKTPARKNRPALIASFILNPEDGVLKATGGGGHHSWWRSTDFDHTVAAVELVVAANHQQNQIHNQ